MKTHCMLCTLALAGAVRAQELLLPDNHHLGENPTQLGNVGTTSWWRTTDGRFQILYEASNFTGKAGVPGAIVITKLKFRGEDGEVNLGGQVYTGVTVEVGSTSLTASNMSPSFATNRAPAFPDTTTMGPLGTTTVTLAPSVGSIPNNWNIVLDLAAMGASFVYDPTSAEPNLLIDITMPTAPSNAPPLALIAMQNTTGGIPVTRGAGVTALSGAASGTYSTIQLVVGVEFAGPGGYPTLIPARNEFYGAACGGAPASFYEGFLNGQPFDLGGGLTLTPDNATAPNLYAVTAGAPPVDYSQVNVAPDSILDDGVVVFPLGFTFAYPGGSTSTIVPSTNGFVWLDSAMSDSGFAAVASRLLGDGVTAVTTYSGARLAVLWHDLNMQRNVAINPLAGLHVKTNTSGGPGNSVCYVTWWDVGEFNTVSGTGVAGHTVWNFQCVLYQATGVVQFRYGGVPAYATASTTTVGCNSLIVGFSPGRIGGAAGINSVDPQSRDLSLEVPFVTSIEGTRGNMGQQAIASPFAGGVQYGGRMFGGQTLTWNAINVPPSAILGVQLLDVAATRPGLMLPTITAPGCMLSTTTGALLWQVFVLPPSTAVGSVPFVVPHGFEGFDIYGQFVVLDGLLSGPDLITVSSNAIKHTIGLQ
ncbi:MAG TPA: hypothetical protein VFZ65_13490 [Planctomycetota bacterium]|nr:hypothetical protein [Planctomycetota bacterium]